MIVDDLRCCGDPPWPDLPADIAVARLRFTVDGLLAADGARTIVPPEVQMARPKRRADYIAGRRCAAAAIQRLTGRDAIVPRDPRGAPRWPEGLSGSISHADGHAIAVVAHASRYRAIGVDIERLLTASQAGALASSIMTPAERDRLADRPLASTVTLAFSLKEALFKALHPLTGTMFYHEDVELVTLAGDRCTLMLRRTLTTQWCAGSVVAATWRLADDQVATLVAIAA